MPSSTAPPANRPSLRVGKNPDGADARDVTVVPVDSEHGLRNLDWIDSNRRKVDALSAGKIAYIYMPNTAGAGYTNFNRYFYAQLDKQAVVLDERFNEGGFIADYVVNVLGQKLLSGAIERDGKPVHDPEGAIFGPKAMIINQSAARAATPCLGISARRIWAHWSECGLGADWSASAGIPR